MVGAHVGPVYAQAFVVVGANATATAAATAMAAQAQTQTQTETGNQTRRLLLLANTQNETRTVRARAGGGIGKGDNLSDRAAVPVSASATLFTVDFEHGARGVPYNRQPIAATAGAGESYYEVVLGGFAVAILAMT